MEKKLYYVISLLLVLTGCISVVDAGVSVFDYDATINSDYEVVAVQSNATINITGGAIETLHVLQNATVNLSAGEITQGIYCYDNSRLNISGTAQINYTISAYGQSVVTMTGGQIKAHNVYFYDDSIFHFYDGLLSPYAIGSGIKLIFRLNSTVYFHGGNPSPSSSESVGIDIGDQTRGYLIDGIIDWVHSQDNAIIYVIGGTIQERLDVYRGGIAHISGGSIKAIWASAGDEESYNVTPKIHIYGNNLLALPYNSETDPLSGIVMGQWLNGSSFAFTLGEGGYPYTILHEGQLPPIICNPQNGDHNNDCRVDITDLSILIADWLSGEDLKNFALMASNWLGCGLVPSDSCW